MPVETSETSTAIVTRGGRCSARRVHQYLFVKLNSISIQIRDPRVFAEFPLQNLGFYRDPLCAKLLNKLK